MPDRHTMAARRRYTAEIKQAEAVAVTARTAYNDTPFLTDARVAAEREWMRAEVLLGGLYGHASHYYPAESLMAMALGRAQDLTYRWAVEYNLDLYVAVHKEIAAEREQRRAGSAASGAEVSR